MKFCNKAMAQKVDGQFVPTRQKSGHVQMGIFLFLGYVRTLTSPIQATALHFAAGFNSSTEVVIELIVAGADVNALDSDQESPLHYAAEMNPDIVPVLLESGANVNLLNYNSLSPLYYAAFSDHDSAVAALMAANADPFLGVSPLFDSDVGEDMKGSIMDLLPLSTPMPEFKLKYRFWSNCTVLHVAMILSLEDEVVKRRGELNRDLLASTCVSKEDRGTWTWTTSKVKNHQNENLNLNLS